MQDPSFITVYFPGYADLVVKNTMQATVTIYIRFVPGGALQAERSSLIGPDPSDTVF